jgi:hypothetical protein
MSNPRALASVVVDARAIGVVRDGFRNLDKQLRLAIKRSVWHTSRRIKKEVDQTLISILHVKAAIVRNRLHIRFNAAKQYDSGFYSSIWIGLNPISLSKLDPRKQAGGVKAGPVFVPEGFMPGGKFGDTVFKRRYETQRLPWDKQYYAFDEEMMKLLKSQILPKIQAIFDNQFQKEVIGLFYERDINTKARARQRTVRKAYDARN